MPKLTVTFYEPVSCELLTLARTWGTTPEDAVARLLFAGEKEEADANNRLCDLTRRELQVLDLIVSGERNAGIAKLLSLSEKTVKNHVHNILGKLKVADRTQAAVLAVRDNLSKATKR